VISCKLNTYCGNRPYSIFREDYHGREMRQIDINVRKVAIPVTPEMKTTDTELYHPKYYQDCTDNSVKHLKECFFVLLFDTLWPREKV
jgi:hypothetical protein